MKITQNNKCSFCRKEVETIEHLFVDCEFSEQLWDHVLSILRNGIGKEIHLSKLDKLFGSINENNAVNHIIMLVKKHIYYKKLINSKPNIKEFKVYMKEVMNMEYYVARLQSKEEECIEKWSGFRE